jgi:hypothetical protein
MLNADEDVAETKDFSPWLYCVAVVSFHLSKGHVVESIHPKNHVRLAEDEIKTIAHFSLPDTTVDSEGDVLYSFRFRGNGDQFSYGSVFFRQTKDISCARGYMQKSVVAVTRSPEFLNVANEFVRVMAPLFFTYGPEVLEVACVECMAWPLPGKHESQLSVAGTHIYSQPYPSTDLFQDIPLFSTFGSLSVGLWLLWELVLTGQQILVLGPTPDRCSKAVLGICSLISPIPLAVDFRPFFTMFDRDFAAISRADNTTPVIVGGTNPFLLRSLEHFPNVVSLGSHRVDSDDTQVARRNQTLRSLLRNRRWERSMVLTREEPLVIKDEKLLSTLRKLGTDPKATIAENNEKLRRAFRDITKRFLEPLEAFVRLRPIGQKAAKGGLRVSAYQDDILREEHFFSRDDFLASISSRSSIRDKQFPVILYKKFMEGPNFTAWLDNERRRLSGERLVIRRTLIVETDVESLLAVSLRGGDALASKVLRALNNEMAKPDRDIELCARMAEHLRALTNKSATTTAI